MQFEVVFYETPTGKVPIVDFLESVDVKMWAKITGLMKVLQDKGPNLREPYTKSLGDGIFELRAKQGSNISRVLFFFYIGGRIIITNGFIKKGPKTPRSELELAKKYKKDFIERETQNSPQKNRRK